MTSPQKKIEEFFSEYPRRTFQKGDIILNPDDELTSLFYICQGNVRMYTLSESGDITIVTIFKPGTYFPLMLILTDFKNEYYFDALTDVTVQIAPKKKVLELLQNDNELLFDIATRFAGAINGLTKRIALTSTESTSERIKSLMTYLETKFETEKSHPDYIQIRHEDIANWLGVSRETVSRTLSKNKTSK
jgi:CRP-like cAMP-binding protein